MRSQKYGACIVEVRSNPRGWSEEGRSFMSGQPVQETIELLTRWAQAVKGELGAAGVYVFGSLVHRGGAQFSKASDVDLVVVIPSEVANAIARTAWLERL